jgi:hypothetical protein
MPAVAKHITHPAGTKALTPGRKAYLVPKSVKPRIRKAIEAMVWQGLDRPQAAASVNMTDNGLYRALKNPEALKYYQNECEVLRSGQRHKNLHRAIALRDQNESGKVSIDAMKFLENDFSENGPQVRVGVNINVQPGYIVDLSKVADRSRQLLEHGGPVIEHKADQ